MCKIRALSEHEHEMAQIQVIINSYLRTKSHQITWDCVQNAGAASFLFNVSRIVGNLIDGWCITLRWRSRFICARSPSSSSSPSPLFALFWFFYFAINVCKTNWSLVSTFFSPLPSLVALELIYIVIGAITVGSPASWFLFRRQSSAQKPRSTWCPWH